MTLLARLAKFLVGIPKAILSVLLVVSLALNIFVQSSSFVANGVSNMWKWISDSASVLENTRQFLNAAKASNEELAAKLAAQSTTVTELSAKVDTLAAKVAEKEAALAAQEAAAGAGRQVVFRGEKVLLKDAVADVSRSVTSRMTNIAGREVASLPGSAVPFFGVAILVSIAGMDIKASCDNARELHELDVAFNPDHEIPPDQNQLCGTKLPTRAELWQQVKDSPGNAYNSASSTLEGFVPDLPTVSDIPSFSDLENSIGNLHWRFWK